MKRSSPSLDISFATRSQSAVQEFRLDGSALYWTQSRPLEKGRSALMVDEGGELSELFPDKNVRSKVHEFGGGSFAAQAKSLLFCDAATSSLWAVLGTRLICLDRNDQKRWADFSFSPDGSKVVCVCEDHSLDEVENSLLMIDLCSLEQKKIHKVHDFYASPQWSPDGRKIAFLFWNFPHMPWDEAHLCALCSTSLKEEKTLGSPLESIGSYAWLPSGDLVFASDRKGFYHLYLSSGERQQILIERKADFASPLWNLGKKSFVFWSEGGRNYLVTQFCEKAVDYLGLLDLKTLEFQVLDFPYTVIRGVDAGVEGIYCLAGSLKSSLALLCFHPFKKTIREIVPPALQEKDCSTFFVEPVAVEASSSLDGNAIFGFFYAPSKPAKNGRPPLIIKCHSGPTAHAQPLLQSEVIFWTSLGFAWLDVNYRGSSGFGRKYREALNGQWGVLDVQDCIDLALSLAQRGLVDPQRWFAKGSSAGGFTALCLAASYPKLKGAVSYYGVTDLELLLKETHKFEKYYLDSLVGDPKKERNIYRERSPVYRAFDIACPVLLFQGDQDPVVPLDQARKLYEQLKKGKLVVFEGEGHGFRKAQTLERALKEERAFYEQWIGEEE